MRNSIIILTLIFIFISCFHKNENIELHKRISTFIHETKQDKIKNKCALIFIGKLGCSSCEIKIENFFAKNYVNSKYIFILPGASNKSLKMKYFNVDLKSPNVIIDSTGRLSELDLIQENTLICYLKKNQIEKTFDLNIDNIDNELIKLTNRCQ